MFCYRRLLARVLTVVLLRSDGPRAAQRANCWANCANFEQNLETVRATEFRRIQS